MVGPTHDGIFEQPMGDFVQRSRLIFIINTRSGGGQGKEALRALRGYARERDPDVVIKELAFDSSTDNLADVTRNDTVVIGGGDGTLSRMIDELKERECRVGLLPLGTGNDLARELGVFDRVRGASPADLCSFYRSAPTRAVSTFALEYGPDYSSTISFINYVSIGFDAKVVSEFARRRHNAPWNRFQGVWTNRLGYGLLCLRFCFFRLTEGVVVKGGGVSTKVGGTRGLLFTNIRSIMGLGISNEKSDPSDMKIECLIVRRISDYLAMVMPRRTGIPLPPVCGSASMWEVVGAGQALPVQVDGEAHPEITSSALRIRVTSSLQMVIGDVG